MSELPESWATAPLSAISTDVPQRVPGETETFTYIDIGSVDRNTKVITTPQVLLGKDAPSRARKQVAEGDTLVSMTRPNLNAVGLVPPSLDGQVASTGFDVLRPLDGIDPRWLAYLVRTEQFVSAMSDLVQGALYPAVRTKDVRAYVVPVAPSEEQTRIADQLDALLARINECHHRLDTIPTLLKRFRMAVLNSAASGKLSEDYRREGAHRSTTVRLGENPVQVPVSWRVTALAEAIDPGRPLCYGVVQPGEDVSDGIPLIRVQDLQGGTVVGEQLRNVSRKVDEEYRRSRVFGGELLISVVGTIGRTAIVPNGLVSNIARAVARIACREGVSSSWIHYWLSTDPLQWHLVSSSKEVARKTLNLSDLARIPLALPSPEEQDVIERRVSALFSIADRIEFRYTAACAQAQRLTPLVLAKAFRGELLPQDPSDEPASTLLARIAAQRESATLVPKIRQTRTPRAARAPKESATMTKSRQDDDVKGKPYLAGHLRRLGEPVEVQVLFKASELQVADFYKQLAWEVSQGLVKDNTTTLEPGHAAG